MMATSIGLVDQYKRSSSRAINSSNVEMLLFLVPCLTAVEPRHRKVRDYAAGGNRGVDMEKHDKDNFDKEENKH